MKRIFLIVLLALALQACGGTYVANEYPIAEDRIERFDVNGTVDVRGAYEQSKPIRIANLDADLMQISDRFADQMGNEIQKRHRGNSGDSKEIIVRVTDMSMSNRIAYMEGRIRVELSLGNGETVNFERRNGSPGVVDRVLNGTIAMAVMEALEDETVRAYLAE